MTGAVRAPAAPAARLGILVVYFLPDERLPILDLHLRAIAGRTSGPYTLYGVAPRVSDSVRQRLAREPQLTLLQFPPVQAVGSQEHAHYLDLLADHAVADGCDRLCTMDVDAFPIRPDWNAQLEKFLQQGSALAAVFRQENGDTALPHPSCCYFPAGFYQRYRPAFLPEAGPGADPAFTTFLARTGQKVDAGIGLGHVLWQHQLPWKRLLRTNQVNDHYLLAGIYGDLVFHVGAMSWTDRDFRQDRRQTPLLRLLDAVADGLRSAGLLRGRVAGLWRRANHLASRPLVRRTNQTFQTVLAALDADADGYIARLRGQPHLQLRPTP
ncbi:MAG: hypothetical protein V4795_05930 [Pseudomonadota bacterium]